MIPQIRLARKLWRFLRLRYLFAIILNTLIFALMFSISILSREIRLFSAFSSWVSSPLFGFFFGVSLFLWISVIPWYPLSICAFMLSRTRPPMVSLYSLKSWVFPQSSATHRISFVCLLTTTWVFMVCFFFFPEYHCRCFF